MSDDPRIVSGATCVWWGPISEAGVRTSSGGWMRPPFSRAMARAGLPCCPHCGGVLFEVQSIEEWWEGVDAFEPTQPGYRKLIEFIRGKHFRNMTDANFALDSARMLELRK